MSDCSGYGLNADVSVTTLGPIGNGQTADLSIKVTDGEIGSPFNQNFDEFANPVVVSDWDGTEVTVDVSSQLRSTGSFSHVGAAPPGGGECSSIEAHVTITPLGASNVMVLLEITVDGCVDPNPGNPPQAFPVVAEFAKRCGGSGPHVVSQTQTGFISTLI